MSRKRASERAWILAGIALAGAFVAATLMRSRPKLKDGSRLLVFGDSMAQGLEPHLASLAKESGIPFKLLHKVGSRIEQWNEGTLRAQLEEAFESFRPTLVFIVLGTNDFYSQRTASEIGDSADALVDWIAKQVNSECYGLGPDLVWVGPPLLPILDAPYPELEAAVDGYAGCGEHAYFATSSRLELRMGSDHIHPTAAGFASWAGALWNWMT